MKKICNCSHLEIIRDIKGNILRIECIACKKTWNWNPLLKYWSDSFVGVFKNKEKI